MIVFWFAIAAICGYLVGSLNYSIIFSKIFMHSDIRSSGSGNAGSTNMMRSYGWRAGLVTLITDFSKTFVVTIGVWAAFTLNYPQYVQTAVALTGLCCCIGHCFPIFFKFKGGKGVAVGAITSLMVDWRCFVIIIATFLIFTAISKYVSLGSMLGAAAFPISLAFFTDYSDNMQIATFIISILVAALIIFLHRKNIVRLITGKESKLSFNKK